MRRLDIGCCAYKDAAKLARAVAAIKQHSVTDWRLLIVDNSPDDSPTRPLIAALAAEDSRIIPHIMPENVGYAGAVNEILAWAESPYIGYLDQDAYVQTHGWDEALCGYLDRWHEIGIVFPGWGPKSIQRPGYREVQWGVGFCWILSRMMMETVGVFDDKIGHQNECDYCMRVRMGGWRCACAPEINVLHDASATNNPASQARIDNGVREFVSKWNKYFNGANYNYHSPMVTRWDDWPPNALYNEEYYLQKLPGLNDNPEVVTVDGAQMDLIKVLRPHDFYKGRSI